MNSEIVDVDSLIGLTVMTMAGAMLKIKKPVKRKYWERPHLGIKQRLVHGQQNLVKELSLSDSGSFFSILRILPHSFDKLLTMVEPSITHYSARAPIDPHTRLCVTLRYLATGETAKSLSYTYRLGISTTSKIIQETTSTIYNCLKPIYLPEPSADMLAKSGEGFEKRWNFPNCCASVDGKHIRMKKPAHSGSLFYNYKNYHSLVMIAVCDFNYKFLAVDVGCQGRNNDSIILNNSEIGTS